MSNIPEARRLLKEVVELLGKSKPTAEKTRVLELVQEAETHLWRNHLGKAQPRKPKEEQKPAAEKKPSKRRAKV